MEKTLIYPLGLSVPDSITDEVEYEKWLNKMLYIVKHTILDDSLIFIGDSNGETSVKLRKPLSTIKSNDWDWFEFHMNGSKSDKAIFFRELRRRVYNVLMYAEELFLNRGGDDITVIMKSLKLKILNGVIALMVCETPQKS